MTKKDSSTTGHGTSHHPGEEKHYVRLTLHERIQHHLVWTTFVTLAVTGFMVEFPESWLVLFDPYRDTVFYWRGLLHRIAAVIMIANLFYFTTYNTCFTQTAIAISAPIIQGQARADAGIQ